MSPQRPNILFIMADDHAAKAISAYGHGLNHTPHIDRLARQGMLFNHCYVTNSICTPSRATILTGTHNHVNCVHTLDSEINNLLPDVAKQLRAWGGYETAMIGKWHLGEGEGHEPSNMGFDYWDVIPGQGEYWDPHFFKGPHGEEYGVKGYATDIITDKAIDFIDRCVDSTAGGEHKPFLVMCHHKAPHRNWEADPKYAHLYKDEIKLPDTFDDDYKNRARAAQAAKMRIEIDMTYADLGLVQPDGGEDAVGPSEVVGARDARNRKIRMPEDVRELKLLDSDTGECFRFESREQLKKWKYQRYMQRYLRTIQSIDDNVGRLLDHLDEKGLTDNTLVIYTSDQGFFLGEHGWFDKRFIYEESFQMPFLARFPGMIPPGSVNNTLISNVDFAPTWLELAGLKIPSFMQGESFLSHLRDPRPEGSEGRGDEDRVAYHRYWMHFDNEHNAYAHYGIRDRRYKLIFWYNQGLSIPGARPGGEEQEWELFDLEHDPMELFNLWSSIPSSSRSVPPPPPAFSSESTRTLSGSSHTSTSTSSWQRVDWSDDLDRVTERMVRLLENKMEEIGDIPQHPVGLPARKLVELYPPLDQRSVVAIAGDDATRGKLGGAAERGKAEQRNL